MLIKSLVCGEGEEEVKKKEEKEEPSNPETQELVDPLPGKLKNCLVNDLHV